MMTDHYEESVSCKIIDENNPDNIDNDSHFPEHDTNNDNQVQQLYSDLGKKLNQLTFLYFLQIRR